MLPPTIMDKNKDWQLELLMEKLRSKASQFKSFQETAKTVRMTMLVGYMLPFFIIFFKLIILCTGQALFFGQC